MSSRKFKDSMPLAPLKIVALGNQTELGEKINKEIIARDTKHFPKCRNLILR